MAVTLASELTDVQRLLRDASNRFYTQQDLTDYINQARNRVAAETWCLRQIQTFTAQVYSCSGTITTNSNQITGITVTTGPAAALDTLGSLTGAVIQGAGIPSNTEITSITASGGTLTMSLPATANGTTFTIQQDGYNWRTVLPNGANTIDLANVTLVWGNLRVPLNYMDWTTFNSLLRTYSLWQQRLQVFSIYNQSVVYIGPPPDQPYLVECDTVVCPAPLVNATDAEVIMYPYTEPVRYYAAHLASYNNQSFSDADRFLNKFKESIMQVCYYAGQRRLSTPYPRY